MLKVSFQKDANQSEESAKASSIVIQKIREAILDEVFKPGDRLGEVELAEIRGQPLTGAGSASRSRKGRHRSYQPVQGCDRKAYFRGGNHEHCGTEVGAHLAGH